MIVPLQASIRSLLPRLHYFDEGTCIVHHMFGAETTSLVRKAYSDALLTAHFEVPTFCHLLACCCYQNVAVPVAIAIAVAIPFCTVLR